MAHLGGFHTFLNKSAVDETELSRLTKQEIRPPTPPPIENDDFEGKIFKIIETIKKGPVAIQDDDVVSIKSAQLTNTHNKPSSRHTTSNNVPTHTNNTALLSGHTQNNVAEDIDIDNLLDDSHTADLNDYVKDSDHMQMANDRLDEIFKKSEVVAPNKFHIPKDPHISEEQKKRLHVENVIHNMSGKTTDIFDKNKKRTIDTKLDKLRKIKNIAMSLTEANKPLPEYEPVTIHSSEEDIDTVLSLLELTKNRISYTTTVQEIAEVGAMVLEYVFNGQRKIPVFDISPDYRGYSQTLRAKLRGLQYEISEAVNETFEGGMGNKTKIAFDLLPSLFTYPYSRHRQSMRNTSQLSTSDGAPSFSNLRDRESDRALLQSINNT